MNDRTVFLTPEGRAKLESERQYLRDVRRPEVAERIKSAKDFSDATDNPELEEAKNEQAFVEGRLLTIDRMLAHAQLITHDSDQHSVVKLGSVVTVSDESGEIEKYFIVGSAEANPRQGRISNQSPVGEALLGRRVNDEISVATPGGRVTFKVLSID
jgi:transcription elongation factor GreA